MAGAAGKPEGAGMIILVHVKAGRTLDELPKGLLKENNFIILLGPRGSFSGLDLPTPAGAVGGAILRITQLQDHAGAFAALADCARLLRRLFSEHLGPLHYIQPSEEFMSDRDTAAVSWTATSDGHVDAFCLSPVVSSSPLLMPLTRELAAQPMTDDRRFAFLAAAFAGV